MKSFHPSIKKPVFLSVHPENRSFVLPSIHPFINPDIMLSCCKYTLTTRWHDISIPLLEGGNMASNPSIWAVVNYKGGVGKSTISAHLAAHLGAEIVDLDAQCDAARFGDKAGIVTHRMSQASTEELFDLVDRLRREGKRVVMDGPPGENPLTGLAILLSDVVVTPTRPGPNDLEALSRVATALREANSVRVAQDGKDAAVPLLLLCNFYRKSAVAQIFVSTLQAIGVGRYIGKLWERNDYAYAVNEGMPVWVHSPGTVAAKEMTDLVTFLEKMGNRPGRESRV